MVQRLKSIKSGTCRPSKADYKMKLNQVMECKFNGRLVTRLYKPETALRYLCNEELFEALHAIHIEKGHSGKDIMKAVFANVTQDS